jgi:transposase
MKKTPAELPDDVELLKKMLLEQQAKSDRQLAQKDKRIAKLETLTQKLTERVQRFEEVLNLAQHKRFSPSSETYEGDGQVFNEAEQVVETVPEEVVEADAPAPETTTEKPAKAPAKPRRPRIAPELPRIEVLHDIDNKTCSCCGNELHRMGEEVSEQVEFIPAQIRVIKHVRPKYSCRACERESTQVSIQIADVPDTIIPKSMATPSLLAQIVSNKMHYGLPLYRQEKMFAEAGIELSRQTMSRWLITCADKLQSLMLLMKAELLKQPVLWADETTLDVLQVDKSTCYMWVYGCGVESSNGPKLVLFDYQDGRSGQHAVQFLEGYSGYLQVDGYAGYEQTSATLAGCWAHARRKFIEAQQAQGKGKTGKASASCSRPLPTIRVGKADWAINQIQKLYALESKLKTQSFEVKQQQRQQVAAPLLKQLWDWLEKSKDTIPKESLVGKAISYTQNQWPKLIRYLEDGRLNIDNNRAERAVKPFVIGRKAWLFANTRTGATGSAVLYSVVETAKINGLEPYNYLNELFEKLPTANTPADLAKLLPY